MDAMTILQDYVDDAAAVRLPGDRPRNVRRPGQVGRMLKQHQPARKPVCPRYIESRRWLEEYLEDDGYDADLDIRAA